MTSYHWENWSFPWSIRFETF